MMSMFLNPWAMIAGGLLIASPIIIHFISRVRYKRVHWAAMEFLLKAQKRIKRILILQQLLLLLLRILLILLFGLLLGRFTGFSGMSDDKRSTVHYVVFDDGPSMSDVWRGEDGATTNAFDQGKKLLDTIAKNASEAVTPQLMDVTLLSEPENSVDFGRLNAESLNNIRERFASAKTSPVRGDLVATLTKIRDRATTGGPETAKIVHILSDCREIDWKESGEAIGKIVKELNDAKVKVKFLDVVHPFRKKEDLAAPLAHDNLAILELTPSKTAVAQYEPVEFKLKVKNYGNAEMQNVRFAIKVNGDEGKGRSVSFESIPGNQEKTERFEITFDRLGSEEKPFDRFSLVSATLETGEAGGIAVDNVRHAVVEVRKKLEVLIVENRPPNQRDAQESDGFYLRRVLQKVLDSFEVVDLAASDLEKADLSKAAFILMLNVPSVTEGTAKNLDEYVRRGGGIGFFMGPDVRAADYNKLLYDNGKGLFPAPLASQPHEPLSPDTVREQRMRFFQKKLVLRGIERRRHPAVARIYTDERGEVSKDADQFERHFGFMVFRQYWTVPRIGEWREDKNVEEIFSMPNLGTMGDYERSTREIVDSIRACLKDEQLGTADDRKKYTDALSKILDEIVKTTSDAKPLYELASMLDGLLCDEGTFGGPNEGVIREFWAQPKASDCKHRTNELRNQVKYGDPLYLTKNHGRGRVTLITTTAGEAWTDWPKDLMGGKTYSPILTEMFNYLSGGGVVSSHNVGASIEYKLDATRYKPVVKRMFMTHEPAEKAAAPEPLKVEDLKEKTLATEGAVHTMSFTENRRPGAYLFGLIGSKAATSGKDLTDEPEYRAVACNVDARESDLRRAARDEMKKLVADIALHSPDDSDWLIGLKNRPSDLSERVWLFLLLILLLIGEQALSVALSHHAHSDEIESTAPSIAAALRKGSEAVTEPEEVA